MSKKSNPKFETYEYQSEYGTILILQEVDIDKVEPGANADDFSCMEKGKPETALCLMGWDEVGMFDHEFKNPVYVRCLRTIGATDLLKPNDDE